MNNKEKNIVALLRFSEFLNAGRWKKKELKKFIKERKVIANQSYPLYSLTIESGVIPKSKRYERAFLVKDELDAYKVVFPEDFVYNPMNLRFGAIAKYRGDVKVALSKYYNIFYCDESVDSDFCELYFKSYQMISYYNDVATGSLIEKRRVHFTDFLNFNIPFPEYKEQQKIAKCLSSLDDVINVEKEKLELLQDHKKGLLQQLFPQKGEVQPKYRFPEFKNDGEWEETTLEKCLDYLQPTPYLVSNTNYNDVYKTPVLTAGKTFILGYTNEEQGIFAEKLPVIIFDDFTTASKFVDFAFKAKSSAMKILLAKDDNNIKFIFEAIQNLKFEVSTHKRHWISVYSKLNILKPKDPKEQEQIVSCLSSIDNLIKSQIEKIDSLQNHKKGLLQQLFPNINEVAV